jgi:hypothetical protein
MKIPDYMKHVTKFTKIVAALLFIVLPFVAFTLGMHYQKALDVPFMLASYQGWLLPGQCAPQ